MGRKREREGKKQMGRKRERERALEFYKISEG